MESNWFVYDAIFVSFKRIYVRVREYPRGGILVIVPCPMA